MILWSHRGFAETKKQENTIKALKNAFDLQYRNIECDIWFLNDNLLMKHDKPTALELQKDSLVHLDCFIKEYGNDLKYWMDFKNLTIKNIDKFLSIYKKIIDNLKINYELIYFAPYKTNWNISIKLHKKMQKYMPGINSMVVMDFKSFEKKKIKDYYKILQENKITNLSIEHKLLDKNFVDIFKGINLFAWTVDDIKEYKRLTNLGIKNICTNKITYANLK